MYISRVLKNVAAANELLNDIEKAILDFTINSNDAKTKTDISQAEESIKLKISF